MALQRLSSTEAPAFASSVEEDFLVEKGNGYENHTVRLFRCTKLIWKSAINIFLMTVLIEKLIGRVLN